MPEEYKIWLQNRLIDCEADAKESHKAAMNSYAAGYDAGKVSAFKEALSQLENPED